MVRRMCGIAALVNTQMTASPNCNAPKLYVVASTLFGNGVELEVLLVHVNRLWYLLSALVLPAAIASLSVSGMPEASDNAVAINGPLPVPLVVPDASVVPDAVELTRKVN